MKKYCIHLAACISRPKNRQALLNSILNNAQFKNSPGLIERFLEHLMNKGVITISENNKVSYNNQKIQEIADQLL